MRDVSANHSSSFGSSGSSSPSFRLPSPCQSPDISEPDDAIADKKLTLELELQSCDEYVEHPKDKGRAQIASNNASSPLQLKKEQEQEQDEQQGAEQEGEPDDLGLTGAAVALYGPLNNTSKDVRDLEQCLKLQDPSGE